VTGACRKLHKEELHDLYSSPNIIRVIKSRRVRWAGHVARMWEIRNAHRFWLEILKERDRSQDLEVEGGIILKLSQGKIFGSL
jgi:hypothetical protein